MIISALPTITKTSLPIAHVATMAFNADTNGTIVKSAGGNWVPRDLFPRIDGTQPFIPACLAFNFEMLATAPTGWMTITLMTPSATVLGTFDLSLTGSTMSRAELPANIFLMREYFGADGEFFMTYSLTGSSLNGANFRLTIAMAPNWSQA